MSISPGIAWMIFSSLCFVLTATFIKAVADEVSHHQAVFFRSIIPLIFILGIARQKSFSVWGSKRGLLWLRGIYGAIQLELYIYCVTKLPIGELSAIIASVPVWVALFSPWLIQEATSKLVYGLMPLFILGLVLIVKFDPETILFWPFMAAIGTAISVSFIQLMIRHLRTRDRPSVIVFYFVFFSSLISLPLAVWNWQPLGLKEWMLLSLSGVSALAAQLSMTQAYRLEQANTVSLFSYVSPIFAYVIGMSFFDEQPDVWSFLGTAIILTCGWVVIRAQKHSK